MVGKQKDSKLPIDQTVADFKPTEDTICIVNFALAGAFKERQSNAATKEEIQKMLRSPFIEENKKGRFVCAGYGLPGRKLNPGEPLPKNYYEGSKEYKPCTYHKCYQRRVYNSLAVAYLSSEEARPSYIGRKAWENMSVPERLSVQFAAEAASMNSINPGFSFEFVN